MAKKQTEQQAEIDYLREENRLQKHRLEAAEKELEVLKSGKPEASAIAESAEVHAAQAANWKEAYAQLAADYADLKHLLQYHDAHTAPPPDLAQRVRYKLTNPNRLENGVPPKGVAS